ncbi:hypothetical protein BUALT_Bualt19G0089700 [Buddleja alternifolia]|uniref:F-box domain-containing protein n=1 Tax=Buddleja alternifolia TaxID=168488 RepID=A0AAV6W625_9LAMI|nr:hypothetical protein BUALT_Bualt19G0089700 [Buddleja alternifolia]
MVESLMELPLNNLVEILSRLPTKTILACRCVCKTFIDLTSPSNPYSTALHSSKPSNQILIIQFARFPKELNTYVNFNDARLVTKSGASATKLRVSPMSKIPKLQIEELVDLFCARSNLTLVNACNGLIYFAVNLRTKWCSLVCNPITNEYVRVRQVDKLRGYTSSSWLGFSASSRKYKVLRIYTYLNKVGAHIHDVGSSSWRDVESTPLNHINWDSSHAFVNGVAYWLSRYDYEVGLMVADFIVYFDFESEMFGTIDAPPGFNSYRLSHRSSMSIGVLDDCLCLIDNTVGLDIWIMEKCDDWKKKYDCVDEFEKPLYLFKATLRPLQELSTGEILMVSNYSDLVCYDEKRNNFRLMNFIKMRSIFNIVTFVPSFVSLKDMLSLMG